MNKELIKKYKAEFDHWLAGGSVLILYPIKSETKLWCSTCEDIWGYSTKDIAIIINDKYVEFRKALAEGKTIQRIKNKYTEFECYKDINIIDHNNFGSPPEFYRIKPEEPKFKVGDWVVGICGDIEQVKQSKLEANPNYYGNCKLWKPQQGEYIWTFREGVCLVEKVLDNDNIQINPLALALWNSVITSTDRCEPYVGKLPSFMENK